MSSCDYSFQEPLGTVSSMTAAYDATAEAHRVTISGTGFAGSNDEVELLIDGLKQTTISVSSNELVFEIVDMLSSSSTDIELYLAEGVPAGMENIAAGITLEPTFISLSPQVGSSGGSLVTVTVSGVGTTATDVMLKNGSTDFCSEATVVSYGVITCQTIAGEVASSDTIQF